MEETNIANTTPVCGNMSMMHETTLPGVAASGKEEQIKEQPSIQRILLVEDDQALATLEEAILTAHGYTVVTVHSGERAVIALRNIVPDLVVLDLELTGAINGWEVLQALRALNSIPVLLTTSSAQAVRTYRRQHGETKLSLDHLPKPYPMQTLLKRVKRMLINTTRGQ
jgi:DNA-binding response OmpR family regulator